MQDKGIILEREIWIVDYIKSASDKTDLRVPSDDYHRTIKGIWEYAQKPKKLNQPRNSSIISEYPGFNETASVSTYHRTIGKLVAEGILVQAGETEEGVAIFDVVPWVTSYQPLSKTELDKALWELGPVISLAYYVEVMDEFEEASHQVLEKAAQGLKNEAPVQLILSMLKDSVAELNYEIADLKDPANKDELHRRRLEEKLQNFSRFVNGELGILPSVWCPPLIDDRVVGANQQLNKMEIVDNIVGPKDWEIVEAELKAHVFGNSFIELYNLSQSELDAKSSIVVGTDGSSHTSQVRGLPASAYYDEENLLLTFNNAAGYVHLPEDYPELYNSNFHGLPITRAALEDPNHRGMIISRPWFSELEDSEYEHMKKVALDVVQYRIDKALFEGKASAYGSSSIMVDALFPKPDLLLRDGAVAPQARELGNYQNKTPYGELVREGIKLSYDILRSVMDSRKRVYAGAVKSTQLKTFSTIINWYIKKGSRFQFGTPIAPNWDARKMGIISDTVMIRKVVSSLDRLEGKNQYYKTCTIVRPFTAMVTNLYRVKTIDGVRTLNDPNDWVEYFERRVAENSKDYEEGKISRPWFYNQGDISEDEYVRMCVYADYGMFYIGKPGMSPELTFPRFEFLDSIRSLQGHEKQIQRVDKNVNTIIKEVHRTKWALDSDHNMFTKNRMPKLVPYVIQEAHNMCKILGHKLILELQQQIVSALSMVKQKIRKSIAVSVKGETPPTPISMYKTDLEKIREYTKVQGENIGDAAPGDFGEQS